MIKLKVYKDKEEEKTVYLRLYEEGNQISLIAVDENGNRINRGLVLSISPGGLCMYKNLNKSIGFPLNSDGTIRDTVS